MNEHAAFFHTGLMSKSGTRSAPACVISGKWKLEKTDFQILLLTSSGVKSLKKFSVCLCVMKREHK